MCCLDPGTITDEAICLNRSDHTTIAETCYLLLLASKRETMSTRTQFIKFRIARPVSVGNRLNGRPSSVFHARPILTIRTRI